jgi:hypothetical protein
MITMMKPYVVKDVTRELRLDRGLDQILLTIKVSYIVTGWQPVHPRQQPAKTLQICRLMIRPWAAFPVSHQPRLQLRNVAAPSRAFGQPVVLSSVSSWVQTDRVSLWTSPVLVAVSVGPKPSATSCTICGLLTTTTATTISTRLRHDCWVR